MDLRKTKLFEGLSQCDLIVVESLCIEKQAKEEVFLIQSELGRNTLYLLIEGTFIVDGNAGSQLNITHLCCPGDFVGGGALFDRLPVANVKAAKGSRYYEIDISKFDRTSSMWLTLVSNVANDAFNKLGSTNSILVDNLKHRIFVAKIITTVFVVICFSIFFISVSDYLHIKPSLEIGRASCRERV